MNRIIKHLKKKKSLSLDKFIDLSLYDKKSGYYMKKNPFGKNGDFITSPLVSNIFGEMIAIWCVFFWESLGKPKKIVIVELGPGDATLCNDILNTFQNFKEFYNCLEIKLLEKSVSLKKIQKSKVKNRKVSWIKSIDEVNSGPIIFISNEFFDSLPIKQIFRKKNLFFEKHITLSKNNKKLKYLLKRAKKNLIKKILDLGLVSTGSVIEYPNVGIQYLEIVAKKIKKYDGGILTFDYGYTKPKNKSTLQSVSKHKYTDIFLNPGNADITSHINYKLFSEILIKNDLQVEKIITQSEFLQKLGIIERAKILSKNKNFIIKADIFYKLKKLLDLNEMGNLFKVMFAKKKGTRFSLGFN
jgi:NADH dehydrogenase [ubiquinone] 1 alpha subcomplex assembly factor 7